MDIKLSSSFSLHNKPLPSNPLTFASDTVFTSSNYKEINYYKKKKIKMNNNLINNNNRLPSLSSNYKHQQFLISSLLSFFF